MELKTCQTCQGVYEASKVNFYRSKKSSDGLRPDCKACRNKQNGANRAKRRAAGRAWQAANPEKVKAYARAAYQRKKDAQIFSFE